MPVTQDQAQRLAALAVDARPHGARRWDAAGVMAAIAKVRHLALADVALAVIRAADDRDLETPGAIGNTQTSCWRERATNRHVDRPHLTPGNTCGICGQHRTKCEQNPYAEHDFEALAYTRSLGRPRPGTEHQEPA